MAHSPTPTSTADLIAKSRDALMALVGFLCLSDAPNVPAKQRTEFAAAAYRQAEAVRRQFRGPLLIVVDRQQAGHYERLRRMFAHDGEVEVVFDRRHGERRAVSAARLVERHQEDRRQRTIDFELSRLGVALVPRVASVPTPAEGESPIKTGNCRVLIIDDDAEVADTLGGYFERKGGYVVQTALSGERGLSALTADRPDVVLLDVSMPGMNGLEVLERIHRIDPSIPVIMVTAATFEAGSEALANGAFAYVPKPVDLRYFDHLVPLATGASSGRR